jgi:hypothetical protein
MKNFGYPAKSQGELKKDLEEAISKKYKIGDYYYGFDHGAFRIGDEAARDLKNSFYDKKMNVVYNHIKFHGLEGYNEGNDFRVKILSTPGIRTKPEKFEKTIENYQEALVNKRVEITKAPSMEKADQLADALYQFQKDMYSALSHESYNVLEDFSVDVLGINPDPH